MKFIKERNIEDSIGKGTKFSEGNKIIVDDT